MSASIKIRPKVVSKTVVKPMKNPQAATAPRKEHAETDGEDEPRIDKTDGRASQASEPDPYDSNDRQADRNNNTGKESNGLGDNNDLNQLMYNPLEMQRFKNKPKVWPPPEGPDDARCYVAEGMGGEHLQAKDEDDETGVEGHMANGRGEIVQDHVEPVSKLKRRFLGKPKRVIPGVNKPQIQVKGPVSWIKHVKPSPDYDEDPKELPWMQLVRNRRWNSTVKARFPCKKDDVTNFERRSTTPKNWKKILRDKHTAKIVSEVAGLEGAGEELLYRLAEQRQKDGEAEQTDEKPLTEDEMLAYQYIRDHLSGGLVSAEEEHRRRSEGRTNGGSPSESEILFNRLLKKPLRLHPEQFKKLLSLERSREATLRWQFSSDPYDSVHEHQYLPFEVALATSDNERLIHQALKKLLQGYDYDFEEVIGQVPNIERSIADGHQRRMSTGSGDEGRWRGVAPQVAPRRSRSVSPCVRCKTEVEGEEEDGVYNAHDRDHEPTVEENILKQELVKLQQEISRKDPINDMVNDSMADGTQKKPNEEGSSEEEEYNLPVEQRMKKLLEGSTKGGGLSKKSSIDQDEIDVSEVASRRKQFLNKERESSLDKPDDQKPRRGRKVQRNRSDAEFHEMLSRRRQWTDASATSGDQEGDSAAERNPDMIEEMTNLINDMQETFSTGNEKK